MQTWMWLAIVAALMLAWYLWTKYGAIYMAIKNNPAAVHAGLSVARYATDIEGLVGAYDSASSDQGSFTSRMGKFFGALPS